MKALKEFLEANQELTVGEAMAQILALAHTPKQSNKQSTSFKIDGKVAAIYCYYHKKWEPVDECEYGVKASSNTGLNTMCKEGVSAWTKQQRLAKVAKEQLLMDVANGSIDPAKLSAKLADIEADRQAIVPREDEVGFDTLEDWLEYLEA